MTKIQQILLLLIISTCCNSYSKDLNFTIIGIENTKGHLQVSVFETQKQFSDETPAQMLYFDKKMLPME